MFSALYLAFLIHCAGPALRAGYALMFALSESIGYKITTEKKRIFTQTSNQGIRIMSEKSKASTLAALALAGVVAVTAPGPASSQDVQPQTTTAQATTQQTQGVRFLDFTNRNDGWAASQTAAIIGSRDRKIVIISYSDGPTTRAIYDTAVQFTRPPQALPVFGVVRAPQHPTEPNPNGFDIYINGVPLGEVPNPDNAYSRTQFFAQLMNNIKRDYFAAATVGAEPIGATNTLMAYTAAEKSGGHKSSSGGGASGGTGSATGSASGGSSGSGDSAGGKDSTEIAAVVFNPDL